MRECVDKMALDYKAMFAEQLALQKKLREAKAAEKQKEDLSQEGTTEARGVLKAEPLQGTDGNIFYYSNFISADYAKELERAVQEHPWTQLPKRKRITVAALSTLP